MKFLSFLIFSFAMVAAAAWAGQPYVSDDPETPELHGWELDVAYTLARTDVQSVHSIPLFEVNYGYRTNIELSLSFPILFIVSKDSSDDAGIGDADLGFKWRFIEEKHAQPQLAIAPLITVPTGNDDNGLGAGKPSFILPLIAQKSWGRWTSYGDLGYVIQNATDTRDYYYYGAVLTKDVTNKLNLGAEVFGNSPMEAKQSSDFGLNLGLELTLHDNLYFQFAIGNSLRDGPKPLAYIGLQYGTEHAPRHIRRLRHGHPEKQ